MAMVECPECKGSGEVWRQINSVMKLILCRYCKGTGEVRWEE